jgi:hypothetical protein
VSITPTLNLNKSTVVDIDHHINVLSDLKELKSAATLSNKGSKKAAKAAFFNSAMLWSLSISLNPLKMVVIILIM